jgi:uncharacterized protein with HEPN domain
MSKRDVSITLAQILEHAQHAQQICRNRTASELNADWKSALALERALEIIGEAVKRLPHELCDAYPTVEWRLITGMRDRLSHGYDDVDHEILWNAVNEDLPKLVETIERMLADTGK